MTVPAVTWRTKVLRRVAGSVGGAVVIAGIVPAVANAAGAGVPNPVAIALRASGRQLSHALSSDSTDTVVAASSCETASATPSVEPSVEPTVEPSVEQSAVETAAPGESVEPTATEAPAESASAGPTVAPTTDCESATPEVSAEPSESESPEAEKSEAADGGDHGLIVSTVAKCAPHGKDERLAVEGAPGNHGAYVNAAAHGDSVTTPWGTFDLSTKAGADALCAALDAAAPTAAPEKTAKHGKPDTEKGSHGKSGEHGKGHKKHGSDDSED
jgi:hypothetical protein